MELSDAESRRRIFESALGRRKRYRDRVFGHSIRQQFSQEAGATSLGRGVVRSIDRGTGNFRADSLGIVDSNAFVDSVESHSPAASNENLPAGYRDSVVCIRSFVPPDIPRPRHLSEFREQRISLDSDRNSFPAA